MSGIFGHFGGAAPALEAVRRMGALMRHNPRLVSEAAAAGPAGALGRIGLGRLNRAPQPVAAADGAVQLYLCGEFYHQERRRTALAQAGALAPLADDAELALAVFLAEGAEGLARLEGAFFVAVWDGRSAILTLVNDRFGLYPHYYTHTAAAFSFAPELKAVLAAPGVACRVDMVAVAEYARFQQLLGERTWIEHVRLFPPATILRYSPLSGRLTMGRYWDWDAITPAPRISFGEAVEETVRRFQRAIDAMTRPPHRVGVYLSGGLDGRTILGFIDPATPVTTLTFGAAHCRDVVYAAALARRAGRPHRWFPFTDGRWVLEHAAMHLALTEGEHGWMHGHGMSTLDEASALIDVQLSGWDGGTIMGGRIYEYATDPAYRHAPDEAALLQRLYAGFCQSFTWPGLTDEEAAALFRHPGNSELAGLARESFAAALGRTSHYAPPYRADYFYLLQHVRRSTQAMIVFQRSAFEVRCPFFDYDLVSFLYALPEQLRCTPDFHRAVITRRLPAMARVPHEKTDELPHSSRLVRGSHSLLQRAKRATNRVAGPIFPTRARLYADYEHYLRTDLRAWAEAILFDRHARERGLFNPAEVRSLWERHQRGDELWTIGKLAPLITIEQVLRSLVDAPQRANSAVAR